MIGSPRWQYKQPVKTVTKATKLIFAKRKNQKNRNIP